MNARQRRVGGRMGRVCESIGSVSLPLNDGTTLPIAGHATTIEAEGIYSRFSESRSDVYGGYVMGQVSLLDAPTTGDLDLFARYDLVSLGAERIAGRAIQRAIRTGFNYNLPYANKLASLHFEYARSDRRTGGDHCRPPQRQRVPPRIPRQPAAVHPPLSAPPDRRRKAVAACAK